MLGLVKVAAYALLGYAIYEVVIGISEGSQGMAPAPQGGQRPRQQRRQGGAAPTPKTRVPVQEADGGIRTERVGRGVIPG